MGGVVSPLALGTAASPIPVGCVFFLSTAEHAFGLPGQDILPTRPATVDALRFHHALLTLETVAYRLLEVSEDNADSPDYPWRPVLVISAP